MAKGEIVVDEMYCRGCGYCRDFCPKKCIILSEDNFTPQGYRLSCFVNPEDCNACGICSFMCPHHAIEVYKYVEV
jgi:2-oxoglutarate ferredoxin oxidoreductase subunit delta